MESERTFAIGEVESLVLKACRGAGFSWGLSQEAGRAAGWLATMRLPALDLYATLLRQTADLSHAQRAPDINSQAWPRVWGSSSKLLCPVVAGTLLSDLGPAFMEEHEMLTFSGTVAPLVLVPFVAMLGLPVTLRIGGAEIGVCGKVLCPSSSAAGLVIKDDVILRIESKRNDFPAAPAPSATAIESMAVRGVGKAESVTLLEALAHQTYVPATQSSRESGAGAGLTDND